MLNETFSVDTRRRLKWWPTEPYKAFEGLITPKIAHDWSLLGLNKLKTTPNKAKAAFASAAQFQAFMASLMAIALWPELCGH